MIDLPAADKIATLRADAQLAESSLVGILSELATIGAGLEIGWLGGVEVPADRWGDVLTFKTMLASTFEKLLKEIRTGFNVCLMDPLPEGQFPKDEDENRCWQAGAGGRDAPNPAYVLAEDREERLVRICPCYFEEQDAHVRMDTLIHELSHLFLMCGHEHWTEAECARNPKILLDSAYFLGQFCRGDMTLKETVEFNMQRVVGIIVDPAYRPGTVAMQG